MAGVTDISGGARAAARGDVPAVSARPTSSNARTAVVEALLRGVARKRTLARRQVDGRRVPRPIRRVAALRDIRRASDTSSRAANGVATAIVAAALAPRQGLRAGRGLGLRGDRRAPRQRHAGRGCHARARARGPSATPASRQVLSCRASSDVRRRALTTLGARLGPDRTLLARCSRAACRAVEKTCRSPDRGPALVQTRGSSPSSITQAAEVPLGRPRCSSAGADPSRAGRRSSTCARSIT